MGWVLFLLLVIIMLVSVLLNLVSPVGRAVNSSYIWQREQLENARADIADLNRELDRKRGRDMRLKCEQLKTAKT